MAVHVVRLVLLKRLVYLAIGRTPHRTGAVAAGDAEWWHLALFDSAVVTDASQQGVRLLHRDRAQMVSMGRQAARVIRRFLAEAPRLRQEYRAAVPELTSRDNWQRLYGL